MMKESKKFPAVMTTVPMLGLDEGTVLRFDWASGKYVSITENEDIAEGEYYYSGYAIALDPYVVKEQVGTVFAYIEEESKDEVEPAPEKTETIEHTVTEEDVKLNPDEDLKEGEKIDIEYKEDKTPHALVVDCACGHRNLVQVIDAPGVSLTLMANNEESQLTLTCAECGSSLRLWFPSDFEYESTEEENKG